ncbi:MAG: N-acetylmuramoyl-L-alanine amidase [Armatimonadetes bacterium]|jgi:hypothetical protein|nr:N-acetylmuramoyl-L-alanine amidase [Armatimonadota bacterium]
MKEALFALIAVTLMAATSAKATEEFFINHWCGPTELKNESFAEVAEANFTVSMIGLGSAEKNLKALDLCAANGIKAMICDPRTGPGPTRDTPTESLDAAIEDYAKHPALWGYHTLDEPHSRMFTRLGGVNQYLLEKDPAHTPLGNLFPSYANSKTLGNSTYEQHVDEYCKVVKPKMLSYDHYALMADGSIRGDYFTNLDIVRRQSIKHKIPFVYTLLSVPHGPYKDINEADLRWQVFTALAYGARGLTYFTYNTPTAEYGDAIIGADGKRTAKYEITKKVNGEIKKLGPTLLKLNTKAVYHTGTLPATCKPLPKDGLIKSAQGGEFVIGQFTSDDGFRYAIIVNRSLTKHAKAAIAFSQQVDLREVSPANGREKAIMVNNIGGDWVWTTSFGPGDGKLVRIDTVNNMPVKSWEDKIVFRPRIMLNPSNQFANQIFDENKKELYNEGMNMYLIAEKVQKILQADGRLDAFMSRNTQAQRTTLREETNLTRSLGCDILYAFHSDATGTSAPGGGSWTFYHGEDGKRLANLVQDALAASIRTFYPELKNMGTRTHWYRLWVLHEGGCQGALTEYLFHTNPKERELLKNPESQDIMAEAVAGAILKYFFDE